MRRDPQAALHALQAMEQDHLRRVRRTVDGYAGEAAISRVIVDGRELVNFCSNDYLGLARDPRLVAALTAAATRYGVGAGAAHLVTGHTREHQALEAELAAFTGREAALLFSTGYMANVGTVCAMAHRGDLVLQDRLNHASLIDGALLSGARFSRYQHASVEDAARRLEGGDERGRLIATDGVFSMDGDIAPVGRLATLAKKKNAWLLVDDAHGLGVLGRGGGGTLAYDNLSPADVPLLVGTLGKAFGTFGAFVAGERDLIDFILQRARSYIYTTAMPPAVAAATRAALHIVREEGWRRDRLVALIARFRRGAAAAGLTVGESTTPIQPILIGDAARSLAASQALREAGYWVSAIRQPTVPPGTERLRVTLSAAHTDREVDGLVTALATVLAPTAAR
jgi:8-amino-7-oxononanoate synthase